MHAIEIDHAVMSSKTTLTPHLELLDQSLVEATDGI
jgi:hypothetical protein